MNSIEYQAKALQEVERLGKLKGEEFSHAETEARTATILAIEEMSKDERLQEASIRDMMASIILTERLSMGMPITPLLTSSFTAGYCMGWMRAKQAQVLR